jgi:hypothetical protein
MVARAVSGKTRVPPTQEYLWYAAGSARIIIMRIIIMFLVPLETGLQLVEWGFALPSSSNPIINMLFKLKISCIYLAHIRYIPYHMIDK